MFILYLYFRGLFKGDKLLGTANLKLQPLENTCILHESYDVSSQGFIQTFLSGTYSLVNFSDGFNLCLLHFNCNEF